ncbi:MAG: hypothetical protein WCC28_06365 [Mycobacterium sp.]|uniref:hypothetical protein n=1 Tax=Mycobacterium sp. TaxID=1785 RepID=UPI003C736567
MIDPSTRITRYTESMRSLVNQAGSLLLHSSDQVNDGTFDLAQCAKSAQQLASAALTTGLEMAPLMMSIPCGPVSFDELELSDFIEVDPDNQCERVLSVAKSFVQDGAPSYVIPDPLIVFVPGILRVYAKRFRVGTSWPNLQSGTYRGQVRLTRTKPATPSAAEVLDVIVDL